MHVRPRMCSMVRATRRLLGGKLAESSWLRFVLDHAPVILFALDPDGRVTLSEGRGLMALGMKPGATVGKSVFDLYGDQPDLIAIVRRALRGEDFEVVASMREGPVFSTRFHPLRGPRGEVAGVVGVSVDVTPQREALEALRRSEARLRLVTDQLPCILWTTDRDLRVTGFAGRLPADVAGSLGRRIEETAMSPRGLDAHQAARHGATASYSYQHEGREYDVHVAPFVDERGETAGCIGLAVDVTDRRRAEAATTRLQTEHGLLLDAAPGGPDQRPP
jgi:PAS domain-containing protein